MSDAASDQSQSQANRQSKVLDDTNRHPKNGEGNHGARTVFHHIAFRAATAMGMPWAFAVAVMSVVIWALCGPMFNFSEVWQLVINTATTIVTFLMIFLVQNTQNRDSRAIHLKLDELLRGVKGARTAMVDLEDATDEELDALQKEFQRLRAAKKR